MMDSPDLSPGSSPWDTNRTNRTRSSGGKYESAHFFTPAVQAKDCLKVLVSVIIHARQPRRQLPHHLIHMKMMIQ